MDINSVCRSWNTDYGAVLLAKLILERPESLQQPGQQQKERRRIRQDEAKEDAKAAARQGESLSLAALVALCHAEALAPAVSRQQDRERLHRSRPAALYAAVPNTLSGRRPQPELAEKRPAKAEPHLQDKRFNMAGGLTAALLRSLAVVVNTTTIHPALGAPGREPDDNLKASSEMKGTGAEAAASAPVETTSRTRAKRCGEGGGIKGDSDNERKCLFEGALRLLRELVVRKADGKTQESASRDMGGGCTDLVWDIVIAVLSDGWSEIRKMGASHARWLAAALGPGKARALYLKAAAACKGALAASEPETPREWKRIHGFLLGMGAAVEGATKTSALSLDLSGNSILDAEGNSHNAAGGKLSTSGSHDRLQEQQQRQAHFPGLAEFAGDLMVGCGTERSGTSRTLVDELGTYHERSKPKHVASEAWCGVQSGRPPSTSDSSIPGEIGEGLYTTPIDLSLPLPPQQSPPIQPPMPPTPTLTSPIAASSSPPDVAFACLGHRQAAVREAAVALLHTLAFALDPGAALSLYERTLESLDRGKQEEDIAVVRAGGGEEDDGLQREILAVGSRGEARLRGDRANGLLTVLERLVGIVPPVPFGESWERVFSVLRFYTGHPQSFLRQAAGAVLLRIAKKSTTEASHLARDPLRAASHHVPERIILWALVCAWKDSASETHARLYCPSKTDGPAERGSRNRDIFRQVDGAKASDWRQVEAETEMTLLEEDAAREAAAETCQGSRSRNLSGNERQNHGLQVYTSLRQTEFARDDKGLKPGEQGDAPAAASSAHNSNGDTMVSWEFREGALMVYEGVLKNLVARCMSDVVSGGHSRDDDNEVLSTPVVFGIAGAAAATTVDTKSAEHYGWPPGLIDSTPPMSEILISVKIQAENALVEAELRLRQRLAIFSNGELVGMSVQPLKAPQETPSGALELWRTASQLLSSIARAMTWCNPNALLEACKRTVNDDLEPAKGMPAALLHLRRRARLSVAAELVRASVRHARHIAELCVDAAADKNMNCIVTEPSDGNCLKETGMVTTTVAAPTAAGQLDVESACIPGDHECLAYGSRVVPVGEDIFLAVTGRERWGASTDGIVDSSREEVVRPLAAAQQSTENVSGSALSLVSAKATEGGSTEVRAGATHAREIVARIVQDTLDLCRDAVPFIVQALEMIGSEGDIPATLVDSGFEELAAGTVSPHGLAIHTGATIGNDVFPLPSKARWVFTGVVEVLVLARTFRATTALLPASNGQRAPANHSFSPSIRSAGKKTRGNRAALPESSDADQDPTVVVQQLELLHGKAYLTPVAGGEVSPSITKSQREENQRCTVAVAGEGGDGVVGGAREVAATNWRAEKGESSARRDIDGGEEGGILPAKSKEEANGDEEPTTNFEVPFSWGSLALVQATPAPWARGGGYDGALAGQGGETGVRAAQGAGQSATNRFAETARKAVQLDRLLSARIVHALPGYVGTLPPEIGIRHIPSLLRWLEAGDDKVRWISVTPVEARTSLLSAIGVALCLGREQTLAARELLQDSLCDESSGHGADPAESTAATSLAPEVETDADVEPRKRQQQQLQAGSIARATMATIARMISNERLGTSFFSQACLVSRDAILLSVPSNFASTESPACDASACEMDQGCATGKGKSFGGISTDAGCHQEERGHMPKEDSRSDDEQCPRRMQLYGKTGQTTKGSDGGHHGNLVADSDANAREEGRATIASLLNAVAEHVLRCFPDIVVCSSESQTAEERGTSPPRRLQQPVTTTEEVVSAATGLNQGLPVMVSGRERESLNYDHDGDNGGGGEWDDWDDSDGDGGGGTSFQATNNTAGGGAWEKAGSEEQYSAAAASAWALMSAAAAAAAAAAMMPSATDKPTSIDPNLRRAGCTGNAGKAVDCERDRISTNKGDNLGIPPSLETVIGELPARNRQALAVAWRRGMMSK